jgi:hypothetical protein
MSPVSQTVTRQNTVTYDVTVTNTDSAECSPSVIVQAISSNAAKGALSLTMLDNRIKLNPGDSATRTLVVGAASSAKLKTYTLTDKAVNKSVKKGRAGIGTANISVVAK